LKNAQTPSTVDLTDIMTVVCAYRREKFAFERYIALMTFSVWLNFPHETTVVEFGRLKAAANMIRAIRSGFLGLSAVKRKRSIESIFQEIITPETVSSLLVDNPIITPFENDFHLIKASGQIDRASRVASFLMQCPKDLRPSLNKALFFIDEGGYFGPAAVSTVKKAWNKFAPVSPFASVTYFFWLDKMTRGEDPFPGGDLFELPPDGAKSPHKSGNFLFKRDDLRDYFSTARFFQENIVSIAGSSSGFVTFPEEIKPLAIPIPPLEEHQLDIVRRYRAPKRM
jgi:hypothetical protein